MMGEMGFAGTVDVRVRRAAVMAPLGWRVRNALRWGFLRGWFAYNVVAPLANALGVATMMGRLDAVLVRADGRRVDYGVLGYRVVTDAFVEDMVDELQSVSEWGDYKYHDSGEDDTAEASGNTDMGSTDGESRVAGTQTEGASAEIYESVGTISYTSTKAIVEHGLFNNSSGATLMDRTVFSTINVENGDSIEFTYQLTCSSGS